MSTPNLSRRDLLAASAAGVALTVLAGCPSKDKNPVITTGTVNIGPPSDYPAGTVSTKFMTQYHIVVTNESGPVIAILNKCTHRGCATDWKPDVSQFVCPCHKSQFNILGQPTKGPATKPMAAVAATPNPDGTLSVNLDNLNRA